MVYVYDLQTRQNVFANRETGVQLGYTPNELAGFGDTLFQKLIHPDDLPEVAIHITRILSSADDEVQEIEYRLRRADGVYRRFLSRDTVFTRDSRTGIVTQYIGTAQDITERRSSEQSLIEKTAKLKEFALRVAAQRNELEQANLRLEALASTDGLTGLLNHRTFQERLQQEFDRARQYESPRISYTVRCRLLQTVQ